MAGLEGIIQITICDCFHWEPIFWNVCSFSLFFHLAYFCYFITHAKDTSSNLMFVDKTSFERLYCVSFVRFEYCKGVLDTSLDLCKVCYQ